MDQKQKDLLNSASLQLADTINFMEMAELVQLAKLVSKETVEDIVVSVLQLLSTVMAFEESIKRAQVIELNCSRSDNLSIPVMLPRDANRDTSIMNLDSSLIRTRAVPLCFLTSFSAQATVDIHPLLFHQYTSLLNYSWYALN